jgi:FKBP-type peptidyl-prolyl cis-trans isomerase FklB
MRNLVTKHTSARAAALVISLSAAAVLFAGSANAQQTQTSASSSQTAPAAKTTKPAGSASTQKTLATKSVAAPLPTEKDKTSYALGSNIGRQLSQQHLTPDMLDSASLLRGLRDGLQGNKSLLTDDQIKAALDGLQGLIEEASLKEGQEFLAKNKAKEGVVTTPSGLQYKVITMGTGPKPTAADTVICDYRGTLIDGKEFDSSYKRGQSATFPVSGVIKGWTEALQMMPVGSKWELFVPPDLAYGGRGAGPDIGPNSTLVFEVELHAIKSK